MVVISFVDAPDWSTSLATMMGIGIGIDYALLMVTRFREWRAAGLDPEAATVATLDTAGRSVMVAGTTVVISMLGLFAMGLSFMRGAAVVTILGVRGRDGRQHHALPGPAGLPRQAHRPAAPPARARAHGRRRRGRPRRAVARAWLGWSRLRRPPPGRRRVVGVVVLLALALPFLDVRFGFPDAGNNREETSSRQAYDMMADGFGAGMNGPLLLVAEVPQRIGRAASTRTRPPSRETSGVAAVAPATLNPAGDTAVLTVIPTDRAAGPGDRGPGHHAARRRHCPSATDGTGVTVHVGGVTATSIDSSDNIAKRLPLLIGGVVLLSMLLLIMRSGRSRSR